MRGVGLCEARARLAHRLRDDRSGHVRAQGCKAVFDLGLDLEASCRVVSVANEDFLTDQNQWDRERFHPEALTESDEGPLVARIAIKLQRPKVYSRLACGKT